MSVGDHLVEQLPGDRIGNRAVQLGIANRVIWPAIAIRHGGDAMWGAGALVEIEKWFDRLEPIVPVERGDPGA